MPVKASVRMTKDRSVDEGTISAIVGALLVTVGVAEGVKLGLTVCCRLGLSVLDLVGLAVGARLGVTGVCSVGTVVGAMDTFDCVGL